MRGDAIVENVGDYGFSATIAPNTQITEGTPLFKEETLELKLDQLLAWVHNYKDQAEVDGKDQVAKAAEHFEKEIKHTKSNLTLKSGRGEEQ